jgi:hypothetical protein
MNSAILQVNFYFREINMNTTIEIGLFLENVARKKETVSYSELCRNFNLPSFNGLWQSHPLSGILETLDQYDAAHNRPFRSAVIVTKEDSSPGKGLFEALSRLKGMKINKRDWDSVWIAELNSAYSYQW